MTITMQMLNAFQNVDIHLEKKGEDFVSHVLSQSESYPSSGWNESFSHFSPAEDDRKQHFCYKPAAASVAGCCWASLSVHQVASQPPAEMRLQESRQEARVQAGGGGAGPRPLTALWGRRPPTDLRPPLGAAGSAQLPSRLQPPPPTARLHRGGRWRLRWCHQWCHGQVLTPCQFTGCSFGLAAIWQYERLKSRVQSYFNEIRADWLEKLRPQKRGDFRKEVRGRSHSCDITRGPGGVTNVLWLECSDPRLSRTHLQSARLRVSGHPDYCNLGVLVLMWWLSG